MNTKRFIVVGLALALCFGWAAYAPGAGAGQRPDLAPSSPAAQKSGGLQVQVQRGRPSRMPVNVVVYDQYWKAVAGADVANQAHIFKGLTVGDYQVVAEADDVELSLAEDIPVFANQTTQVKLTLEQPVALAGAASAADKAWKGACFAGSGGDGNLIKVYPTFGTTIIYLQCGRIVGKVLPTGCGCSAGNWRYTTDCQKNNTIYVSLPCPRH
jgi:hypothetical protein